MNKMTPQIRFQGFTDDWEERKLSELATMNARIGWQNLRTSEFLDNGDYMLITGTDFKAGAIDYSNIHYVEKERFEQDKKIQISNKSILITKDGTLGKVAYVEGLTMPATLNAGVFNVRVKEDLAIDSKYLFHYLKAPFLLKFADQRSTGGTIKHLNQNVLVEFPIPLPSLGEQHKIAGLLSNFDNTIALHQRMLDLLKEQKKGFLQKMFPKNGTKVPELRFSGFADDWEERKSKELCTISTGKGNTQDKVDDGAYPFYVRSATIEKSDEYLYDQEAVLTVGDGVGTGKVYHYVNGKYNLHQRVYRMYDFKDVSAKYFYYYFSKNFYKRVMSMTAKTSVDSVRMEMIADMNIVFPSVKEQENIVELFSNLDNTIALHQRKLDLLKEQKKGFLQKMFVS
ncbi:restriction endonuclease subunit S [Leuconostoc suionicum]|uniref:restriction endonuclease subunit S n=1 Tax=Leuconostoc suionicum TaxID=1511761 RepID=UPI00186B6205|nr:restriction endonuclease subunit S [Leuconostoc suionicum]MBE4728086.1 restriction endonuclease subunit S [Leuconostoc suionicum]MDI6681914.1 restriction endonuclease subunit S [Leuconostoc suionicum]